MGTALAFFLFYEGSNPFFAYLHPHFRTFKIQVSRHQKTAQPRGFLHPGSWDLKIPENGCQKDDLALRQELNSHKTEYQTAQRASGEKFAGLFLLAYIAGHGKLPPKKRPAFLFSKGADKIDNLNNLADRKSVV